MSLSGDSGSLRQLAACDAELVERARERGDVIARLEARKVAVARFKTTGARQRPMAPGQDVVPLTEESARKAYQARYAELVHDLEGELQGSRPLLRRLADDLMRIEEERARVLLELPPEVRSAYEARVLLGPPALALAENGSCAGCQALLPADRSDETPETCPSCHRLLYSMQLTASER